MGFLRFLAALAGLGFGRYTIDKYEAGFYPEAAIGFVIFAACWLFVGKGIVNWFNEHIEID